MFDDPEVRFGEEEIIVSKTDPQGRITYANEVFLRVSGYKEDELLGKPHNIIRHSDMPRTVFKLLWETIDGGREIFAYVANRAKGGEVYWVLAHVTPRYDRSGAIIGHHSSRRCPKPAAIGRIRPIYQKLVEAERRHTDRKAGMEAATALLNEVLASKGQSYDQFILDL